jgi:hypothetical protein
MIVNSIEDMNEIIIKNPHLVWEGWDVAHVVQDDYAEYLSIGFFDKKTSKWYKKTVYKIDDFGWDIPESVVGHEI